MAQIKNKLQQVLQIKSDLKDAINSTGCPGLSEHSAFNAYANTIRNHLVYPQNTLNITANRTYDVTNYKHVNVNVPIQVYVASATGSSSATEITFAGLPKMPFAFFIDFDGTDQAVTGKNIGRISDGHYYNSTFEYNYVEVTSGNEAHIITGQGGIFFDQSTNDLTVMTENISNAGPYFSASRYELIAVYTLD